MSDTIEPEGSGDEEFDLLTRAIPEMEDAARKIGLYMEQAVPMQVPLPPYGEPQLAVVAHFTIGEVAFSDRVQQPEVDQLERQFAEIEAGAAADEFLDIRNRLARSKGKNVDPLDLLDED
jgi:hypothetical protein